MASRFLFNDAERTFTQATDGTARERELALALALLGAQPRSRQNIQSAESSLRALVASSPHDHVGRMARFHIGRILESHRFDPPQENELAEARSIYLELLNDKTGHPLLELAASRIVLIDLMARNPGKQEIPSRVKELRSLQPLLQTESGQREFHLTLGNTLVERECMPEAALDHLLAAAAFPQPLPQVRADNLLGVASLASHLGRNALAKEYFQKFLAEFQRDSRAYTVRQILTRLDSPHGKNP